MEKAGRPESTYEFRVSVFASNGNQIDLAFVRGLDSARTVSKVEEVLHERFIEEASFLVENFCTVVVRKKMVDCNISGQKICESTRVFCRPGHSSQPDCEAFLDVLSLSPEELESLSERLSWLGSVSHEGDTVSTLDLVGFLLEKTQTNHPLDGLDVHTTMMNIRSRYPDGIAPAYEVPPTTSMATVFGKVPDLTPELVGRGHDGATLGQVTLN